MVKIFAFLFSILLLCGHASAEEMHSRYGVITALPITGTDSRFKIEFEGKEIATVVAEDVTLYRVTPHGTPEYVVVEKFNPGLYCRYEYHLVVIRSDKQFQLSPSFGECHQLASSKYLRYRVQVVLTSTGPIKGKETYLWVRGKLTKH